MKIDVPKLTGREFRKFDWYGWVMCGIGLTLMAYFGGLYGHTPNWWMLAAIFVCFWEYAVRVAYGRVYKFVYYDTILHPMYELQVSGSDSRFFVNAENEDELALYMELHYPSMNYKILDTIHTETFIKTERFI